VNARDAYARLGRSGKRTISTSEAAAVLRVTPLATVHHLRRLSETGLVSKLRKGLWLIGPAATDRYALVEELTSPQPSYVSLHTALYLHGMIEQVPAIVYAVTIGKTEKIKTSIADYSFHHLAPELFTGFQRGPADAPIAVPEKALFDMAYFSGARTRRFSHVPELELPKRFDERKLRGWIARIEASRRRSMVEHRLEAWLEAATTDTTRRTRKRAK
jgi:predicted transcriptional regulator of viral defense system